MIDEELKANIMPATVLLNNFVDNESHSNYEYFLMEYLNQSLFFQKKSEHHVYEHPLSESNSEPDATTPSYEIDFKLLASRSYLRGLRLASPSVSVPCKGVTAYGPPREPNKNFRVGEIHKIFRSLTLDDMLYLRENQNNKPLCDEVDILDVLNTIETEKNLLLFFPYMFYTKREIKQDKLTFLVKEAIENDFIELATYRSRSVPKFETYIVTECNNYFILFTFNPTGFQYIEKIEVQRLPTYVKLLKYSKQFR
ncbi:hypothetical protein [Streptococcus sp. Marseille-P6264]|uniref:hypothetical protein n=1 Tax=Streptococcus sp. Marseille-P6264 TaxID=2487315 RepID=UPI0011E6210A|nr:hypothetical protein [Streptococcus sp. Marseille-P6264]